MKRFMTALVLTLFVAAGAQALDTTDLVAIAAMPLAVAAVSDVSGVPPSDLISVVSAMNRAAVPAPQFVEIVRYAPVAFVDDTIDPPFVTYVNTQSERGIHGDAFAVSLADELRRYDVEEINVVQPVYLAPAMVVQRDYVPAYVVTRVEQRRTDPLSLIAMPLAVAAVSQLAGIDSGQLFGLISSLNRASMPAPQFVEIVRYSPMVLLDRDPQFVTFVTREVDRGIVRTALARSIADRYRTYGLTEIDVVAPRRVRIVRDQNDFLPPVVVTRVAERRAHPHGGAPGQLKKDLRVQTGAEIVHGDKPGRDHITRPSSRQVQVTGKAKKEKKRDATARSRGRSDDGDGKKSQVERQRKQESRQQMKSDRGPTKAKASRARKGDGNGKGKGKGKG